MSALVTDRGSLPARRVPLPVRLGADVHGWAVSMEEPMHEGAERARVEAAVPATLQHAVSRRITSFLAGRLCATRALEAAGCRPCTSVATQPDGAPEWPRGYVGSITHTDHFAAAVIASRTDRRGVGIDSEHVITSLVAAEIADEVCPELLE